MLIRDLRRDENAVLDDLFARLSADSRYLRFHTVVPALTDRLRRMLLNVDGIDRVALLAEVDDTVVGIARFIRDRPMSEEAEVAVAVADTWQRRGVGRSLVGALIIRAGQLGVTRLHASILPWNGPALNLFRTMFPVSLTRHEHGTTTLVGLLAESGEWEITMDDVLQELVS